MDQKQMDGGGPHVSLDSTLPTYFGFVRRGGDGKEVQFIEGPTRSATHVMGVFDDMTTLSLDLKSAGSLEPLAPGAALLRGFALPLAAALAETVRGVSAAAPFRHMLTPGGSRMSVAMTNCGDYGWVSDEGGYRYSPTDPGSGAPWPPLPEVLVDLAARAAAAAGFEDFVPDACLVNRYSPGSRLTLHQDKDERDPRHPIVSVSLGVPAVFLFGGLKRSDRALRLTLEHGDVVVWGGPSRLRYHGIAPLGEAHQTFAGEHRINLTLRRAR